MLHAHLQVHATCCSTQLLVGSDLCCDVPAQHQIIGIWGFDLPSARATLQTFTTLAKRRGASTLPVRHGDAASVAELKGVRLPQIKARVI